VRIAAIADLHCTKDGVGILRPIFAGLPQRADVLVLCGDLTDRGLPAEARVLAGELAGIGLPIVGVLGNHDVEAGQAEEVMTILGTAGVEILDGEGCEIRGVGFAGSKGFAGGFDPLALGPWGEAAIKAFVQEALDEAQKLEAALAGLRTTERVALLHYAPIRATVHGEPPEIVPFLGSSRLAEPIDRRGASLVFHGHAHRGTLEGRTARDVPVYNVAKPLLEACFPGRPPLRLIDLS
jgi:Icc-related predicted phosphoesterase